MPRERHPLKDSDYDIIGEKEFDDFIEIKLPETEADLNTIIELSLQAYKLQIERINHAPLDMQDHLWSTAQKYLADSKDAIYKKQYLQLQHQKENARNKREGLLNETEEAEVSQGKNNQRTFTRADLLQMNRK